MYPHWRGIFYPERLAQSRWFAHYAERFDTVEINGSFYRLPRAAAFDRWRAQAPKHFLYAVKAPMWAANLSWLLRSGKSADVFLEPIRHLGPMLGPVLYQLPRGRRVDLDLLAKFVDLLPTGLVHVFEFRHPSWFTPDVKAFLAKRDLAFCIHDHQATGYESPDWATAKTVYWRFHGNRRSRRGSYGDAALRHAAERMAKLSRRGHRVYVYFNNDVWGAALANARRLKFLLREHERLI